MMRAWATSNQDNLDISTREFKTALGEYKSSGNKIACSYFYSLYLNLLKESGDLISAHNIIDEILQEIKKSNEKYVKAELLRIKGELAIADAAQPNYNLAEKYFTEALEFTQLQKTRSLTLRTLINLSQVAEKNS